MTAERGRAERAVSDERYLDILNHVLHVSRGAGIIHHGLLVSGRVVQFSDDFFFSLDLDLHDLCDFLDGSAFEDEMVETDLAVEDSDGISNEIEALQQSGKVEIDLSQGQTVVEGLVESLLSLRET